MNRVQHYVSGIYSRQSIAGDEYLVLRPVILLCILNHKLFPERVPCVSYHDTRESATGECFLNGLAYAFVELPKFQKKEPEFDKNEEDWWIDYLKTAHLRDEIPPQAPASIQKAYHALEAFNWTSLEMEVYEQALWAELSEKKTREKEREEGREEGLKEGRKERDYAIARLMLQEGDSLKKVQRLIGLTPKEIKNLT